MHIQVGGNYAYNTFRDDIRKCYWNAGVQNYPTVFLINESQITDEQILDDLCSFLNSGQILNLFEGEDFEKAILNTRRVLNELGEPEFRAEKDLFDFFIAQVKANLHLIICMNPLNPFFREKW